VECIATVTNASRDASPERLAASTQELATPVVQGGRRGYGLTRKIERVGDGSGGDRRAGDAGGMVGGGKD
jgi:hypothetical protein